MFLAWAIKCIPLIFSCSHFKILVLQYPFPSWATKLLFHPYFNSLIYRLFDFFRKSYFLFPNQSTYSLSSLFSFHIILPNLFTYIYDSMFVNVATCLIDQYTSLWKDIHISLQVSLASSCLSVHWSIWLTKYRFLFFVCVYLIINGCEWMLECRHENICESWELESCHFYEDCVNHECLVDKQDRLWKMNLISCMQGLTSMGAS